MEGPIYHSVIFGGVRAPAAAGAFLTHSVNFDDDGSRDGAFLTTADGMGAQLSLADDFTLVAWVKPHIIQATLRIVMAIGNDDHSHMAENGLCFGYDDADDGGQINTWPDGAAGDNPLLNGFQNNYNNTGGAGLTENQWDLIAVRHDGSAGVCEFVANGVVVTAGSSSGSLATLTDAADRTFYLGGSPQSDVRGSSCSMASFGAYSVELSDAQLLALYQAGNHDWRLTSGNYDAAAVAALEHYYAGTAATVAAFGTDLVGSHDLDTVHGTHGPADGNMETDVPAAP